MMVEAYNEDKIKDQGIWVDIFPYDNLKKPNSFSMKLRKKLFDYITTMISIKIDVDYYKNSKIKKTILKIVSWLFSINQLYKIRNYICTIDNKEKTSYICSFDDDFKLCCNGFEYNKFFPVKMSKFEDKKYAIPKEYDYILKNYKLLVIDRNNEFSNVIKSFNNKNIIKCDIEASNISSSSIRNDISKLYERLDSRTIKYIINNELYKSRSKNV